MSNWIAELKTKLNIVDFIRNDGIDLKNDGLDRYSAKCPFHNENTPSFKVSESYQNFKCFGCQESGDVIAYFAKRNVLDYYSAATMLAEKLGIKITETNSEQIAKTNKFFKIASDLEEFYKNSFKSLSEFHPAKQEIVNRKLQITDDFGYAPSNNNDMIEYMTKLGHSIEDLTELGFVTEKGGPQLRDRLVFFIKNYMGKTIGFSGRILTKEVNGYKYVNSKASLIFNKQQALYNIEQAKNLSKQLKLIFIVEGQFDVIAMKQHGYTNTVAISGSAMTDLHIRDIRRCVGDDGKITLVLDGDEAGKKAMLKVFQNFPELHKQLYVIEIPSSKDPCDWLMENNRLPKAKNMLTTIFDTIKSRRPLTIVENRTLFLKEIEEEFAKYITNKIIREQYLRNAYILTGQEFSPENFQYIEKKKDYNKSQEVGMNLPPEDKYYLAAISCFLANKKIISENLNKNIFPIRYRTFIEEVNSNINNIFVPENYTNSKLATAISNLPIERFDTEKEAISHFNTLITLAKENENKKQELNHLSSLINNIDGLEPEKIINILKQMEG